MKQMTNREALEAIERFRSLAHGHAVLAEALDMAIKALSAQPEQNCVLTVWGECSYAETGCSECQIKAKITTALSCSESPNRSDTIYRQDAMDALAKFVPYAIFDESTEAYTNGLMDAYNLICQLPSSQPEQLTDKEQRIFLSAMGREEKICKEVDKECWDCCEPHKDSLVKTCHEITRKVKGALWT